MKIEVLQKDKLWWLVINGVEVASSKLQCDALLVAKQLSNFAADQLESVLARAWEEASQDVREATRYGSSDKTCDLITAKFEAKAAAIREAAGRKK